MIEFHEISHRYGQIPVLHNASLSLTEGSIHFLTGPSGSGKTTFLKLCYLALRPSSGHITLFGKETGKLTRDEVAGMRRRIGVVHQDCQFLDHLNVRENIGLPLTVAGQDWQSRQDEIDDLLSWVDLSHRADLNPPELSGGERQRLALARAVILSPDAIIADEPTGNIDWDMGQRVMSLLIELNRLGKTILIATHDMNLIRAIGSKTNARVLRLKNGQILRSETTL